jgi:hypothetical protein
VRGRGRGRDLPKQKQEREPSTKIDPKWKHAISKSAGISGATTSAHRTGLEWFGPAATTPCYTVPCLSASIPKAPLPLLLLYMTHDALVRIAIAHGYEVQACMSGQEQLGVWGRASMNGAIAERSRSLYTRERRWPSRQMFQRWEIWAGGSVNGDEHL